MAQSLWCSLLQPSSHLTITSKHTSCWTHSDITESNDMNDRVKSTTPLAMLKANDNIAHTSSDLIYAGRHYNLQYTKLIEIIQERFPKTRSLTAPEVRKYWEVRHHLSTDNSLAILNQRIIISTSQHAKILHCLHSAHQDEVGINYYYYVWINKKIR